MAGGFWRVKTDDAVPVEPVIAAAEITAISASSKPAKSRDQSLELKVSIHRALLDKINLNALEQLSRAQIELEVRDLVLEILEARKGLLNNAERQRLIVEVLDELLGLGPLEPLLKDETITDILVKRSRPSFRMTSICSGSSRRLSAQSVDGSTNRHPMSMPGWPMDRGSMRSLLRWRSMARACRSASSPRSGSGWSDWSNSVRSRRRWRRCCRRWSVRGAMC
jgi:hypothetical protein